jgi:DNA-binding NarL/FixJ family response regulator
MFNILIIDGNTKLRKRIKKIIVSTLPFLIVAEASDEKESLSEIEKTRPNLVIMDIRLADGHGLKLTKKLKRRYPLMPIAINTDNDAPEYKTACLQAGADYFLSKKTNSINDMLSLVKSIHLRESDDLGKIYECDCI